MAFLLRQFKTLNSEAHTRALVRTSSELTAVARGNLNRSQRSARGTLAYDKKKGFMDETTGSEELAEKAKDQVAEAAAQVKEAAGAAASEARQFAEAAWHDVAHGSCSRTARQLCPATSRAPLAMKPFPPRSYSSVGDLRPGISILR